MAVLNCPGNGVADDKGLYYFVPRMVEYYLGEKAILQNAPTYLPYYEEDRDYVLANAERLVIKDVSEAGGYGVVFGRDLEHDRLEKLKDLIRSEPRRWIAQEVINFKDLETMEDHGVVYRKADLRAFVLSSSDGEVVWKSGLTRFARQADSFVVNSSQGGGLQGHLGHARSSVASEILVESSTVIEKRTRHVFHISRQGQSSFLAGALRRASLRPASFPAPGTTICAWMKAGKTLFRSTAASFL